MEYHEGMIGEDLQRSGWVWLFERDHPFLHLDGHILLFEGVNEAVRNKNSKMCSLNELT